MIPIIVLANADDSKTNVKSKKAAYGFFIFLALAIVALVINVFLNRIVSKEDPSPVIIFNADGEAASPIEMQKNWEKFRKNIISNYSFFFQKY